MPYTLSQLRLLLLLALTLLVGLGVREWRAGFPDAAERFERFDREERMSPMLPDADPPPAAAGPGGGAGLAAPTATGQSSRPASPAIAHTSPRTSASPTPRPPGALVPFAPVGQAKPAPSPPAEPLDVNRADVAELARLPGVGAGLAQRIVEERERRGRFDSPEALRYVLGMGPKKLAAIRRYITVRE